MILRSAVHDRLLVASPCYKIKLPGTPPRRLQAFTAEQVGALFEHAPPRDYAVLALGVGTGMRQGEVLDLTLPHLRLLARELSVELQGRVVPGGPPEITPEFKTTASRRVLPLPDFVVTDLARHIELFGRGPEQTVFFSPRGSVWRRRSFNESVWKPALERAGLPREYGFHSLRHTHASSLISAGLHPRVIQARLGHKSIVETMDTYNEETTRALDAHYGAALLRRSHGA